MTLATHEYGGKGPVLLLLHGGDKLETWRSFAPLLLRKADLRNALRLAELYQDRGRGSRPSGSRRLGVPC